MYRHLTVLTLLIIALILSGCSREKPKVQYPDNNRPEVERIPPSKCRKKPPTPEQIEEVRLQQVIEGCAAGSLYRIPVTSYGGWGGR